MSYSVFIHRFKGGEPHPAPYVEVSHILRRYGSIDSAGDRLEFTPKGDDLCEVGFISGDDETGIDSIGFERPVSGGPLAQLVFEILSIPGMCYFELDCTYVMARTDITNELPEGLLEQCASGRITVISSASEVQL